MIDGYDEVIGVVLRQRSIWTGRSPKEKTTGVENPLSDESVTGTLAGVVLPLMCMSTSSVSRVNVNDGGPVYAATVTVRLFEAAGVVDASPG